ncbi:sulfotransferase family protein [Marimonas arenosa]|uniref:Uncharacterized protein n=1 Tax=Marimonas arenosa TaxID=1795305 RepID=A0AAE4B6F1_9RHOB|nr:sulfotransferase [Marimonas arenosa]MDQ2092270.1 hypothetical protein [Marimonas arenosa]
MNVAEPMHESKDRIAPAEKTTSAARHALIVLGMHRSGTSALTGSLQLLGCSAPAHEMAPHEQNPKGFFESVPIVELNDRILAASGQKWRDWTAPPEMRLPNSLETEFLEHAKTLLSAEFGSAPVFALKDPRMCRLLPFWLKAFEASDIAPVVVHIHRSPHEVARSLETRNQMTVSYGYLLWMTHVLQAEVDSRGLPRCFVSFTHLLRDPVGTLERIESRLPLRFARTPADARDDLKAFLDSGLRHYAADPDAELPRLIRDVLETLERWEKSGEDKRGRIALDLARAAYFALLAESPDGDTDSLSRALDHIGTVETDATQEVVNMKKMTKPELIKLAASLQEANLALRKSTEENQDKIAKKSAKIAELGTCIEQRDRELASLGQMVTQAEDIADDLETRLAEQTRLSHKLSDTLASLSRQKDELAAEKSALISEQDDVRQRAEALERENGELHALVARVEGQRKALENENGELHALVARVEGQRQTLENENGELHALVAKVEDQRQVLERENGELHALVARIEDQRQKIANSTIWRATKPLRKTMNLFRGSKSG